MTSALEVLARAYGAEVGTGSHCAACGESPFHTAGPKDQLIGANYTDWDAFRAPWHQDVCTGCMRLMRGRPGDTPPPLRMMSVFVSPLGLLAYPMPAEVHALLDAPPPGEWVLSWATSKKRHHWLYAEISTQAHVIVGSDQGPIAYDPREDRPILDAVRELIAKPRGFTRKAVREGQYEAPGIAKFGAHRWRELEAVIAPARSRGLIALLAWCTPEDTSAEKQEGAKMVDPNDDRAARLLGAIARSSAIRATDGLMFWGGFFRHRVERFARLPLATFVSRLLDECRVDAPGAEHALTLLRAFSADEISATERAIRLRGGLVVALAYDHRKGKV